jgi:hypothetical protein
VSNGIVTTADAVRQELLRLAQQMRNSPLADATPDEVVMTDGKLASKRDPSRAVSIANAMRHGGVDRIEQEKTTTFDHDGSQAHNTHSAVFAEVKVDEQLGVIRVARIVSAVAAGRILNTKTASSQIIGGVVWGIGMALHEETLLDHKFGRIMNANIAEYHVPVNADVRDIKVIFVDEPDDTVNPLGIKGWAKLASSESPRQSPTRSITRPASGCATCRSLWTSCYCKPEPRGPVASTQPSSIRHAAQIDEDLPNGRSRRESIITGRSAEGPLSEPQPRGARKLTSTPLS